MARQCLEALRFLHEDMRLTHTDLKLENAPPAMDQGDMDDEWIWQSVGTCWNPHWNILKHIETIYILKYKVMMVL